MSPNLVHRVLTWSSKQTFIVFAAFLVYVLADGTTFSFGLYVDELISEYSKEKTNSTFFINTVAALTQSVPLLLSPLVCWGTTKYGASSALFLGCMLSASGYFLPFIFQHYRTFWVSAIGYGCLYSVGLAFCYVPAYLTLPFYFEDDRGLATGLAVSGSGVGQVALAVIVKTCIIKYDWRGASLVTGGLFLLILISVVAFRKPVDQHSSDSATSPLNTELVELSNVSSTTVTVPDEYSREEKPLPEQSYPRRSRGMTIAQVLPLLISSVPVRTGVTLPSAVSPPTVTEINCDRRYSLNLGSRRRTIIAESPPIQDSTVKTTQRLRANTIAGPLQLLRQFNGSSERIRHPLQPPTLAPIMASGENSEEASLSSVSSLKPPTSLMPLLTPLPPPQLPPVSLQESPVEQTENIEEPTKEKHWLLNGRFLLFCLSNFALCLVIGVPYVIIPAYISETFGDQGYFASLALSNVGIASALGQIFLGYLHDRKIFSAWLMYTFAVTVSGASLAILALFRYKLIVLICAFLFGLAISANYALQVLIVIDALSMENMANAFGILQFCQGVSTLIGIPLQGLLRDLSHTYKLSFLTSGFIIILSGMGMFLWPCLSSTDKKVDNVDDGK